VPNTFKVGDIEVIVVSDGEAKFPATGYFPMSTAEQWEPHKRLLDHEGNLTFPFGCFVVKSGGRTVLIDTGLGPIESGPWRGGDLLGELAAAGVSPEEIDVVFCTHLHLDHCGSVALRDGDHMRITFPKAVYRWTSAEQAHWSSGAARPQDTRPRALAAVAERWEAADGEASLARGVEVYAMPGHTPGHAGVVISSGTARAFVLGDGVSCPVQLTETEWSGLGDVDGKLARASQEAMAREVEGTGALVGASHFPGLTFGRVLVGEGRRYWSPLG
jgi:glyoxylase-like metal-dependent hydrolase (beta-lactamase superfamily II)